MIYTLSIAPSIDYTLDLEEKELKIGCVNRPKSKGLSLGGKGITVSRMLKNLKIDSVPIVAIGGRNGEMIKEMIDKEFKDAIYLETETESRIDVMITGPSHDTRFDPAAPKIKDEELHRLFVLLDEKIKDGDILVLAGSLGQEDKSLYADIIARLAKKNIKVFLDSVDEALKNALPYHPFMIKPNQEELGDLTGKVLNSREEIIDAALALKKNGPKSILVTLGKDGAFYFAEDDSIYHCSCAKGVQVSAVGAGDSSIAGFIKGVFDNKKVEDVLVSSMAAGGATAFSEYLGSYELYEKLISQITVEKIS